MNLPELSALELRRLIGTKTISPVELMDACIARIEQYNPAINAIPRRILSVRVPVRNKQKQPSCAGISLVYCTGYP